MCVQYMRVTRACMHTHTHTHARARTHILQGIMHGFVLYKWCSSLSEHSLNKDLSEVNKKLNKLKKDNEKLEASHTELKAEVT